MLAATKAVHLQHGWSRLGVFWCFLMHDDATWPINGHYQCLKCKRIYRVPWGNA